MSELAGKLALVTGAAGGIGRAVATGLAEQGAQVVAADHSERVLELAAALTARGLCCDARKLDVADAEAVDMLIDELELERPIELLAHVQSQGVLYVARSVARRMKLRGRGALVIVNANEGLVPPAQRAAQAASKAAAHLFARHLMLELAGSGVRCEWVEPTTNLASADAERVLASVRNGLPLRLGRPDEIARAVLNAFSA